MSKIDRFGAISDAVAVVRDAAPMLTVATIAILALFIGQDFLQGDEITATDILVQLIAGVDVLFGFAFVLGGIAGSINRKVIR